MEPNKRFKCEIYSQKFTRSSNLKIHVKTKHDKVKLDEIEEQLLLTICKNKAPLNVNSLSLEERERFDSALRCEICHVKFDPNDRLKCKNLDHCHYTNKYRCNIGMHRVQCAIC